MELLKLFSLMRKIFHKSRKSYGTVPCGEADSPTPRLPSAAARSGVQLLQRVLRAPSFTEAGLVSEGMLGK